jgi:hypothetical protein
MKSSDVMAYAHPYVWICYSTYNGLLFYNTGLEELKGVQIKL